MSRFVNNRKLVLIYCAISIAAGNMIFTSSQPSYAEGWGDLLKPLVKDVIVPGASMGMKKLMERNNKKHSQTTEETSGSSESDSANTDTSWTDSAFSTPEEPMSSTSTDDMSMSTPEEPISVSSQETSPMEPPPPPPPPVETPSM